MTRFEEKQHNQTHKILDWITLISFIIALGCAFIVFITIKLDAPKTTDIFITIAFIFGTVGAMMVGISGMIDRKHW